MGSLYLSRLTSSEYENLKNRLLSRQNGTCFICLKEIDLSVQEVDIDHVIPLATGGRDDESNFAITHSNCNRSKQSTNLEVARILHHFKTIKEETTEQTDRNPNLQDILERYEGAKDGIKFAIEGKTVRYSLPQTGVDDIFEADLFTDEKSRFQYFFTMLHIRYLHHDDKINPRTIGSNVSKLIEEFYKGNPQLHISLGWIDTKTESPSKVKIFDGQHKAAAQILLGVDELPVRVFVNPVLPVLLKTNTNAGTTLRQIAFAKDVQRYLGSELYIDRVERFKQDMHLPAEYYGFSELDLVGHFKGESREMKRYIIDSIRTAIAHSRENKLRDFIDFEGGRAKEKPFSYGAIEKTFYSRFIYPDVLATPIDYKMEEGENPRELEKAQIVDLMNIIAEELFIGGKYDMGLGTHQIESRIQKKDYPPQSHIIAFRMSREEILHNWLSYIEQIVKTKFLMEATGHIDEKMFFQRKFPESLWQNIRNFVCNLASLPIWVNYELSQTVFAKRSYDYWKQIFATGKTPDGIEVMVPINIPEMISACH